MKRGSYNIAPGRIYPKRPPNAWDFRGCKHKQPVHAKGIKTFLLCKSYAVHPLYSDDVSAVTCKKCLKLCLNVSKGDL